MLKSLFARPLILEFGERSVRFSHVQDFEFALSSRTEVPATKISELIRFSSEELMREASNIREVEKRFVDVVARSLEEPGSIDYLLRQLDAKLFSQDHDWRAIIQALINQRARFNDFKQVALVKYVQYLGSRQDVLKSLYANQVSTPREREPVATNADAGGADPSFARQTLIFDVDSIKDFGAINEPSREGGDRYERLPRGEVVPIPLKNGEQIEVILSRHRFVLIAAESYHLSDGGDADFRLREGRNIIGRMPASDVILDVSYRDVSRKHLIVDVRGDGIIEFTDLSSHGTFLPRGYQEVTSGL